MREVVAATAVAWMVLIPPAAGFEFSGARMQGSAGTLLLSRPGVVETLSMPGVDLIDGATAFEAGYERRFELSDLDRTYAAAAGRRGRLVLAAGLAQFGRAGLYAETTTRALVGVVMGTGALGASLSYRTIEFGGGYDRLDAVSFGFAGSLRVGRVRLGASGERLNSPRFHAGAVPYEPRSSLFAELTGPGAFSLMGRVTLEKLQKPRFGIGQKVDLSGRAMFFWGMTTSPRTYGGGLEVTVRRLVLTYATFYHPTLGFTHTASLGYRFGAPRAEQPDDR